MTQDLSGHADINTLQKMVEAVQPKNIVPIHTFRGADYSKHFNFPVILTNDGEVI